MGAFKRLTIARLHLAVLGHNPWGREIYFHRIPQRFLGHYVLETVAGGYY